MSNNRPVAASLAAAAFAQGRMQEALDHVQRALNDEPDDPVLVDIAAKSAVALNLNQQAEAYFLKAIELSPHNTLNYSNLGVLYALTKKYDDAEAVLRKALGINVNDADIHSKLSYVFTEMRRYSQAEMAHRISIVLAPHHVEYYLKFGHFLKMRQRFDEAESCYREAIRIDPNDPHGYFHLANVQGDRELYLAAEGAYREALLRKPDYAEAWSNLGVTLKVMKRYDEAENCYRRAIEINPSDSGVYSNLGVLCVWTGRFAEAEDVYRRGLALQPDNHDLMFNLAYVLLLSGRFEEGWSYYEARYHPKNSHPVCGTPNVLFPQWRGESLQGKSILVWHEQGLGDVIQFSRYATYLKARGASCVTLVCEKVLQPLLKTLSGVDAVIPVQELSLTRLHDYWTLLGSLPFCCRATMDTIPSLPAYLAVLPERKKIWKNYLPRSGLRVGLVWKATHRHKSSLERSLPSLRTLQKLWQVPKVSFVSLQKEDGEDEAFYPPPGQPITHLGSSLQDFADTAAIVDQLDLVICVDTAILHVAGALGKPVWILLPFVADWRWLRDREDSPWYPSARLFRQTRTGEWSDVVDRVAAALQEFKK